MAERSVVWIGNGAWDTIAVLFGDEHELERIDDAALWARLQAGQRPDVLVLAGAGAAERCARVRSRYDELELPIAVVSDGAAAPLPAGANDSLGAPLDSADLRARVRLLVRLRRLHATRAAVGAPSAAALMRLNNPLSYVLANISLVRERVDELKTALSDAAARDATCAELVYALELSEVREALADACTGAERVRQIVVDLKTLSRVDEDRRERVVILPAAPLRPVVSRALLPSQKSARGRILVIDDEAAIAAALRRMLGRQHEVHTTTSAADALTRLEHDRFDVVFCDLMMPTMSGMDLYESLSERESPMRDRFVFMTGGAFSPRAREFLERVPNEKLEKPFEPARLRKLVRDLLGAPRS
jgi:CheY-like chemotaxis protein